MGSKNRSYILTLSLFAFSGLNAQTGGDLGPQSVEVKGEYAPNITEAHKILDFPVMDDSVPPAPKLSYNITSKQVPVQFEVEPIQPATMKGEPLVKLYNHLAKIGLGNYNTPYAEYWYNMRRSKKMLIAANAGHLSSSAKIRDYGEAKNSTTHVSGFSKFFLEKNTIDATLGYKRDGYTMYGYSRENLAAMNVIPGVFSTPKIYDIVDAKINAASLFADSTSFNHHESGRYYYFADNNGWKEHGVTVKGGLNKFVNEELFGIDLNVQYYRISGLFGSKSNYLVSANPYVSMNKPKIVARLGAIIGVEYDSSSSTYFYPDVKAEYRAVEEVFTIYGELTGGAVRNSYRSLATENPFFMSPFILKNTRERFGAGAGMKGLIGSDITYNLFGKYRHVEDDYFYTFYPNDLLQNSFDVIFDNVNEIRVHADLGYKAAEKVSLTLKGDYFKYDMATEARAWYRPDYQVGLSGKYNLESKIILTTDIFYVGTRYGKINRLDESNTIVTGEQKLKGYLDLNLGAEYRYSKRLGMFLNINNIAGVRYFRYVNYPVYRLNLLAGISYSF